MFCFIFLSFIKLLLPHLNWHWKSIKSMLWKWSKLCRSGRTWLGPWWMKLRRGRSLKELMKLVLSAIANMGLFQGPEFRILCFSVCILNLKEGFNSCISFRPHKIWIFPWAWAQSCSLWPRPRASPQNPFTLISMIQPTTLLPVLHRHDCLSRDSISQIGRN